MDKYLWSLSALKSWEDIDVLYRHPPFPGINYQVNLYWVKHNSGQGPVTEDDGVESQ